MEKGINTIMKIYRKKTSGIVLLKIYIIIISVKRTNLHENGPV